MTQKRCRILWRTLTLYLVGNGCRSDSDFLTPVVGKCDQRKSRNLRLKYCFQLWILIGSIRKELLTAIRIRRQTIAIQGSGSRIVRYQSSNVEVVGLETEPVERQE